MTDLQPAAPPVPGPDGSRPSGHPPGSRPPRPAHDPAAGRGRPPVLEPLASVHRTLHPKADLALLQHAYEVADAKHAGQKRKSGDPVHHPPAGRRDDPRRAGHGHHHAGGGAAARHGGGHRLLAGAAARASSARRWRTSSTASPSWTRSSSATRPRPRPSARWSSRWPATRGCWSSSCPTGCTTCARCASCRRRSRRRRRARRSRCSRRWRTGSGWRRSSGSWRTCPSRSCTRRSTPRSSGWSPPGRPSRDTYLKQVIDEVRQQLDAARITNDRSRAGPSTTTRSTAR